MDGVFSIEQTNAIHLGTLPVERDAGAGYWRHAVLHELEAGRSGAVQTRCAAFAKVLDSGSLTSILVGRVALYRRDMFFGRFKLWRLS